MKLYRVHIDRVLYIVADDALEAERLAVHVDPNVDETETEVEPATLNGLETDGWANHPPYGQTHKNLKVASEFVKKS